MKTDFSVFEMQNAEEILRLIKDSRLDEAIDRLRSLKDSTYAVIPEKQRISRGITWVVERLSRLLFECCDDADLAYMTALRLFKNLDYPDHLIGVPIFLMAIVGCEKSIEVLPFFYQVAGVGDWVTREFCAGAFRNVIGPNKEMVQLWLKELAIDPDPNLRRFTAETLRPVTVNQWMTKNPDYSLDVLHLMFREAHPYPRSSVGNNLSDLSRRQPELILDIVKELVDMDDKNSLWIAYRACRNQVKRDPQRVMDLLGVDEYHYKDRNFNRIVSLE